MNTTVSKTKAQKPSPMLKADFERLANFRYELRQFLRKSESFCQGNGVTPLQYQMLLQIKGTSGREWATIGEIAEQLQSKHNGVVALVDRCEKAGLVERRPGRDDRRKVEIHLLPKGDALVSKVAALHQSELRLLKHVFDLPGWK